MRSHRLIVALMLVLAIGGCDQVDFTAPTGSTLTIIAQPPSVAVNGFSSITITGTRDNGAPLPDGTVITLTSNLGSIDPNPVETEDGVAITRFRAGTRSGTATISAASGEAAAVTTDIVIGEARAARLILTGTPIQLPIGGGRVNVRANVVDESGNPLAGVGVIFSTTAGELDSRGRVIRTNDSGLAVDTLRTTIAATVTAETLSGLAGEDTVDVTIGEGVPCDFFISPPSPNVGQLVTFTDPNSGGSGLEFFWDFGDGQTAEGPIVTHVYELEGDYTVVHTVVDAQGFSSTCTEVVTVTLDIPTCSFEVVPVDPDENTQVSFDASQSSATSGIATFEWNFGDNTPTVTETDPFTNHVYSLPGCGAGADIDIQVGLIVTDNQGQTSFCSQTITVFCN